MTESVRAELQRRLELTDEQIASEGLMNLLPVKRDALLMPIAAHLFTRMAFAILRRLPE